MPLYGPLPQHHGELLFAESLLALDDGRTHVFFDVMLPGVSNIDVVVWDEDEGVFCLEVKAVPLNMIEEISPSEIVIQGRGRSRSPMSQVRKGAFELLSFLREANPNVPWLTATVAWPQISRSAWESHWHSSDLPKAYADSMVFANDVSSLETLRQRLRWVRRNAPWGSAEPRPFEHDASDLERFVASLLGRATIEQTSSPNPSAEVKKEVVGALDAHHTPARSMRERIILDTDSVQDSARSLLALVQDAEDSLSEGWAADMRTRIQEIIARLDRPFKLGVVGEMKAGKSSVLNALVGSEVALTNAIECTFCPQRVAFGETESAKIQRPDGVLEVEAGELIETLRAVLDDPGHGGISSVECFLPAGILENIEIWDSPGFGGSDGTHALAGQFIEVIDAALWVFNKDYMGQRQLDQVLTGLQSRGKSIIGVVNKCENVSKQRFDELRTYLERAYPTVRYSALIPFSAKLALSPESEQGRDEMVTDGSGNIKLLLETLRSQIINNPGRLSARAAAGDLRAICYSVRDDIQRSLLDEKRRLFLYKSQLERGTDLLAGRLARLGELFEAEAITKLRQVLTTDSAGRLQKMPMSELRSPERFKRVIEQSVSKERIREVLDEFFVANHDQIVQAVRAAGVDMFEDFVGRLTEFERLGQVSQWDFDVQMSEPSPESKDRAAGVAVFTGAALGAVALAIPGPQWPFVAVGVLVSYLAARNLTKGDDALSDNDLRSVRKDEWALAINRYLESAGDDVRNAIRTVLGQVQVEATDILRRQIISVALGSKSPENRMAELSKLEALRQGAEMLIEQLGDAGLELPAASAVNSGPLSLEQGNRSEAQSSLKRILGSSREMLAVTDGGLGSPVFPVFLDVPDEAAVRILAWQQPTSTAGEAFRIGLAELRSKRSGAVHVVAPVQVANDVEPLPSETWLFVPGWAYRLNVSLLEAWNATDSVRIEPFEDDGSLYQQHFGRWFDDNVAGYQGLQV